MESGGQSQAKHTAVLTPTALLSEEGGGGIGTLRRGIRVAAPGRCLFVAEKELAELIQPNLKPATPLHSVDKVN